MRRTLSSSINRFALESLESRALLSAPVIQSVAFNRNSAQTLAYQFSTPVNASVNASTLVLYNLTRRTTLQTSFIGFNYNSSTNTATFTFPGFSKGILPEGNYQAILYGQRVTDSGGVPMAADSNFSFTVYNGDANGDTAVNALDFGALAANWGKSAPTYAQGDLNYDTKVNSLDFNLLASRFNTVYPEPTAPPRVIDVTTFNAAPEGSADYFTQNMFDHLNLPREGGIFFAMGTDAHRSEIEAQGNSLAVYYNNLTVDMQISDPNVMIQRIQNNALTFTTTGQQPTWIIMNEMSGSQWPPDANQAYREWIKTVVHTLHVTYGHEVVLFTPFDHPGAHPEDWAALAKDCYLAPENYQSGLEIKNAGFSLATLQARYQQTETSYNNLGVPTSRIFLGEDYAQTNSGAGTGWGREGVSMADWDHAIQVRSQAIHNVGFYGSISYAWSKNAMGILEAEMIHYEDTYRAQTLP